MKTVYCDIVFLSNFTADFILLYICSKYLHIKPNLKRITISSCIGGIFSIICAIFITRSILRTSFSILFSAVLCRTSTGRQSKKMLFRHTFTFIMLSMVLCGCVLWTKGVFSTNFGNGISMWILLTGIALMTFTYMFIARRIQSISQIKTVDIQFEYQGKNNRFTLLCDSGNLLTDPYTALPVIILKKDITDNDSSYMSFFHNKTRYIPITTANGQGIIKAIRPEKLKLVEKNSCMQIEAIIGFASGINADYGGTDGIIPLCLIRNL